MYNYIYIVVCAYGGEYWIHGAFWDEEEARNYQKSLHEHCHIECWNGSRKVF